MKILIIEDESILLARLSQAFEEEHFEVIRASNGDEGLEKSLREHPDAIILDIVMPGMDGLSLLKLLRKDNWGRKAPVFILTNNTNTNKLADAMSSGTFEYLVKSDWALEDIVREIKEKVHVQRTPDLAVQATDE